MKLLKMASLLVFTTCLAAQENPDTQFDEAQIMEVARLYDLNEAQARERIASEIAAADLAGAIPEDLITGFAGKWFDGESNALAVGTTNLDDVEIIDRLGATPVLVDHDLSSLRSAEEAALDLLTTEGFVADRVVVETSVNVMTNAVEVHVLSEFVALLKNAWVSYCQSNHRNWSSERSDLSDRPWHFVPLVRS
jgi:hypothetical protein